jgi:hypothetical protein
LQRLCRVTRKLLFLAFFSLLARRLCAPFPHWGNAYALYRCTMHYDSSMSQSDYFGGRISKGPQTTNLKTILHGLLDIYHTAEWIFDMVIDL